MRGKLSEWFARFRLGDLEDRRVAVGNTWAALIFMAAVAVNDVWAGAEISLWVLYSFPVAVISWFNGSRYGAAAAGLAVILLCIAAMWTGHPYSSVLYFGIATFSQGVAFVLVALLVGSQRRLLRNSSALTRFLDSIKTEDRSAQQAQSRKPFLSGMWDTHPAIALLRGVQEMIRSGGGYTGKSIDVGSFMVAARTTDVKRIYGGFPLTETFLQKMAKEAGFQIVVTESQVMLLSSHLQASPGGAKS